MTGNFLSNISNGADVILAQPVAGETVWSLQCESPILEGTTAGRANPRFKRWFTEVALKGLLHLFPQLTALQHQNPPLANAESTRLMAPLRSLMKPVQTSFGSCQLLFPMSWHDPCRGSGSA